MAISTDLLTIAPFLVMCVTGILVLLAAAFVPLNKGQNSTCVGLSLLGIVGAAFQTGHLWAQPGCLGFSDTVATDTFALLFQFLLLLICGLSVLLSERYIKLKDINHGEYYALLLFSTSGGMLMASGKELILIFVGLEILSISLYILSGFARTEEKSEESAIKYFLLGAFSSAFFLYGIAMIYGGTGIANTTLDPVTHGLIHHPSTMIDNIGLGHLNAYTLTGLALLLVGLFFKAAIVPFHVWTPDVYEGAPTSVTAFMSVAAKTAAFAVLLRIMPIFLTYGHDSFILAGQVTELHAILWILAAATMIVGNVVALWQTDVKRLLAYSSIAHAGYMLVGVLADNQEGRAAILFYILVYAFMNIGAFGVLMLLNKQGDERTSLRDIQGLGYRQPLAAAAMSIFMFSLAGIPPTAGFVGKLMLFLAATHAHLYGLAVLGFLASVVGAYYYLLVVAKMWMVAPDHEQTARQEHLEWSPATRIAIGLAAILTVGLFLFPQGLLTAFGNVSTTRSTVSAGATIVGNASSRHLQGGESHQNTFPVVAALNLPSASTGANFLK